jgi:hypothetical protein
MTTHPLRQQLVRRRGAVLLLVLYLACSAVGVGLVMHHYPYPSPIDEVVHFDYIHDFPHVPVNGETISPEGLDEWACRTMGPEYPLRVPDCGGPYVAKKFPGDGFSTAGSTPPLYYGVTAVIARPVVKVTPWSLWDVSRAIGALWLTALMVVIHLLARRLGVPTATAAAAAVFTGLSPTVVASAGTMGPDTATAVTSGLAMIAALTYDGSRRRLLLLLGAVTLAAVTKFTAFAAVGAVIVYLVLRPVLARDPEQRRLRPGLLAAAGCLAVFGVISFVWGLRFQRSGLVDPDTIPINVLLHADKVDWGAIWEQMLYTFFSPGTGNWQPGFLADGTNSFVVTVTSGVFAAGVLVAALALRNRPRVSALGLGLLVMVLVSPFLLVALNFYANHLYFQLSPRYGYALLPGIAAVTAWAFRAPAHGRALLLLAALSIVNLLT